MMKNDKCLVCGAATPDGIQVCKECAEKIHIEAGETVEIAEEMRDIAGILSITANTDGNIKRSMESILRIADRLERKDNEKRTKIFAKGSIGETKHSDHTGRSAAGTKGARLH